MSDSAIAAQFATFDLRHEIQKVRQMQAERPNDRVTNAVVSFPLLKLLVASISKGTAWTKHSAPGRITVQVLEGRIRMNALQESVELSAGQVFALEAGIPHDLLGLEDSVFLLTVAKST